MEKSKFDDLKACIETAFQEVSDILLGYSAVKCSEAKDMEEKTFCVIIGTVGRNKGRILLEAGAGTVKMITENMNGEPSGNIMDMYMCLSEFANMVCGNAVTLINNKYKGSELRLTPPAVFSGSGMEITTPNIQSSCSHYLCEYGPILLDIGFEGM